MIWLGRMEQSCLSDWPRLLHDVLPHHSPMSQIWKQTYLYVIALDPLLYCFAPSWFSAAMNTTLPAAWTFTNTVASIAMVPLSLKYPGRFESFWRCSFGWGGCLPAFSYRSSCGRYLKPPYWRPLTWKGLSWSCHGIDSLLNILALPLSCFYLSVDWGPEPCGSCH